MSHSALTDAGVLTLRSQITQDTIDPLIDAILTLNLDGGRECLRLYVNSPGGDVDQGFALIDVMRWSRIPIHTTALGTVASMALLIFMAGARGHRTVMPHCSLLSHRFATITGGNHADLIAARVQQDLIHRRIVNHYRTTTVLDNDALIESTVLQSTDRWLTPAEAVAYGIADHVWSPTTTPGVHHGS